jgi:hypothetical protein
MVYYITILIMFLGSDNEEIHRYVQHKEQYLSYSECGYYLNSEPMQEYIQKSLEKHLCNKFKGNKPTYKIVEQGCMTRDTYIDYNNNL